MIAYLSTGKNAKMNEWPFYYVGEIQLLKYSQIENLVVLENNFNQLRW